MTTPNGTAVAARQSASGYALRVSPRGERLTPLDGTPANGLMESAKYTGVFSAGS